MGVAKNKTFPAVACVSAVSLLSCDNVSVRLLSRCFKAVPFGLRVFANGIFG